MELAGTWKLAQDLILPRFTVIYLYSSSLWKWAPVLPTWPDHTLAAQHCSSSLIFVSYVKMHISRDLCIKSNLLCNSSKILRKPTFWLQKPPCSELPFPYYSPAFQTTLPPSPPAHQPTRPAASGQPTNQATTALHTLRDASAFLVLLWLWVGGWAGTLVSNLLNITPICYIPPQISQVQPAIS